MFQLRVPSSVVTTNPDNSRTVVRENSSNIRSERFQAPSSVTDEDGATDPEKIHTWIKDVCQQLERLQQNLKDQTLPVRSNRTIFANYFPDQTFISGTTYTIRHGLGKAFQGYRVCNQRKVPDTATVTYPSPTSLLIYSTPNSSTDLDESQIQLVAGDTFLADVEIW